MQVVNLISPQPYWIISLLSDPSKLQNLEFVMKTFRVENSLWLLRYKVCHFDQHRLKTCEHLYLEQKSVQKYHQKLWEGNLGRI